MTTIRKLLLFLLALVTCPLWIPAACLFVAWLCIAWFTTKEDE